MFYLDHAANSWPKPSAVYNALDQGYARQPGALSLPGQIQSGDARPAIIQAAQAELAPLFNLPNPEGLFFTSSCAEALSLAFSLFHWQKGDAIVISALEHQDLLSPVFQLARTQGVQVYIVPYTEAEPFSLAECEALLDAHPEIRLIATTHASNAIGCMLPLSEISRLARRYGKPYLVDTAQTAGIRPIDVQRDGIALLAFPGHQFLKGPRGTGALYVSEAIRNASLAAPMDTLLEGQLSESSLISIPKLLGLTAGARWLRELSLSSIQRHTTELLAYLQDELEAIPEVTVYGLTDISRHIPLLSFNVLNHHPEALAQQLFQEFGIRLRAGLHHSRLSHEAIGTLHRGGTLRASLGYTTCPEDIEALIQALKRIVIGYSSWGDWGSGRSEIANA